MVRDTAWTLVQEALDSRATSHREALATSRGDYEYLTWNSAGGSRRLTIVEVADMPWGIKAMTFSTPDIVLHTQPTESAKLPPHRAFRFYRLSRSSDDLFDAFRNAYLCLECLLSDVSPKPPSEAEPAWLTRVLRDLYGSSLPAGITAEQLVQLIYNNGRLPLFHANSNRTFYSPYCAEREELHRVFIYLDALLTRILHARFGPQVPAGWGSMSQLVIDAAATAVLQYDSAYFPDVELRTGVTVEIISEPRRFGNLWARVDVELPAGLNSLQRMTFKKGDEEACNFTFPEPIQLTERMSLSLEIAYVSYNHSAPRPIYSR